MYHKGTTALRQGLPNPATVRKQDRGFTLLELLIVIAMMIFISTIAVVNYFGVTRAASYSAISTNVFNALLTARQRACLDNKTVYFYLQNNTNFVLQESFGTIAGIDPDGGTGGYIFYDPYVSSLSFQSNSVLLNIDVPGSGAIVWQSSPGNYTIHGIDANGNAVSYSTTACELFVTNNSASASFTWSIGNHYGMQLYAPQTLPKGFVFSPQGAGNSIAFLPDGTVDLSNLPSPPLTIIESINNKKVTFTITTTGKITQGP